MQHGWYLHWCDEDWRVCAVPEWRYLPSRWEPGQPSDEVALEGAIEVAIEVAIEIAIEIAIRVAIKVAF